MDTRAGQLPVATSKSNSWNDSALAFLCVTYKWLNIKYNRLEWFFLLQRADSS